MARWLRGYGSVAPWLWLGGSVAMARWLRGYGSVAPWLWLGGSVAMARWLRGYGSVAPWLWLQGSAGVTPRLRGYGGAAREAAAPGTVLCVPARVHIARRWAACGVPGPWRGIRGTPVCRDSSAFRAQRARHGFARPGPRPRDGQSAYRQRHPPPAAASQRGHLAATPPPGGTGKASAALRAATGARRTSRGATSRTRTGAGTWPRRARQPRGQWQGPPAPRYR